MLIESEIITLLTGIHNLLCLCFWD